LLLDPLILVGSILHLIVVYYLIRFGILAEIVGLQKIRISHNKTSSHNNMVFPIFSLDTKANTMRTFKALRRPFLACSFPANLLRRHAEISSGLHGRSQANKGKTRADLQPQPKVPFSSLARAREAC
ncbi:hypothetical protein PIB30_103434, partial [Stylosanthes scabra]|nr:hypothetical protein [Stylosanthes scabra]